MYTEVHCCMYMYMYMYTYGQVYGMYYMYNVFGDFSRFIFWELGL